ncbi:MAG: ABC transporter permease subunit [Clostridia bacterium]|nr:ABC transporter permease subunit [Clostridia bacterium]
MNVLKRIAKYALIAVFWVCVWVLITLALDQPLLFPYPHTVFKRLFQLMQTKEFYEITALSLWNVMRGILIAVGLGCALSALTARFLTVRELLLPAMTVIKATPVASVIILLWLFIGSAKLPTVITVLIVLPVVWTNLDEGWARIDPQLKEMVRVYRISWYRRLFYLTLPSLKPYFVSACLTSIGLAWKAGIAAEIIVRPLGSIGLMIGDAKYYLMAEDMFAWTLVVILLSLIIESLFSFLLGRLGGERRKKEVRIND